MRCVPDSVDLWIFRERERGRECERTREHVMEIYMGKGRTRRENLKV